jgi:hypothetical protein
MTQKTRRVLTIIGCCLAMAAVLMAAPPAKAQNGSRSSVSLKARAGAKQKTAISIQPMLVFSDHSVLRGGGSMLVRTKTGVFMSMHAFGLPVGDAVTAWFIIFNNPQNCATHPCSGADLPTADVQASVVNATGRIVGADGTADFGAFRMAGDATGTESGPGLLDSFKAEIHFVVRSHGPAIVDNPETLQQQLTMFVGGCPPNTCANLNVSIHQP